jgi:N-acetylneuraminic acid mutarotase
MYEARSGVGVAVVNGKIYAIGGAGKGGFRAFNEEYDPATDTWTFKASMPTPRSSFGIAVYQNKIYCMGGYIPEDATGVNEVYDPATDTWETKAPMPTARLNLQASIVNGKIYLIGGNSNGTLNEVYDPVNDTWLTKASIPTAVSSYASAVVDNKIYVITSNLNQIYDAENDSWSLGASAPSPAILASAGATTGVYAPKRIYVFGADAKMPYWQLTLRNFTAQNYDLKTNSWTVCASMPTGRFDASVAVVNDRLYVIGGFTLEFPPDRFTLNPSYMFSAVNEQYTPIGYGTVPPTLHVVSPENKTYTSSNVSLIFAVNKQTSWLGYSLDAQENVTVTGNTTLTGLSDGSHSLTVYANDTAGNVGYSETIYFNVAQQSEPFPITWIAAAIAIIAIAGVAGYLFLRRKK